MTVADDIDSSGGLRAASFGQDFEEPRISVSTPSAPSAPLVTGSSQPERLEAVRSARNPLLEAAQPLLRALADMPQVLPPEEVDALHGLLLREVASFQAVCDNAQIRHDHVVGASYALCTALDERAHSTDWGTTADHGAGAWAARQLAVVFHDDARGGDKVFLLIGRLVAGPDEHIDLIEVLYFVLGLGFEGRYGAAANGRRQIETIRHRLFSLLSASRAEVPHALSPRSPGAGPALSRRARSVPPWMTASAAGLVLLVLFGIYKYRLLRMEAEALGRVALIGTSNGDAVMEKPGRALRLKALLADEIARGTVDVDEDGTRSAVTFRGDEMFVAGQARLNARIVPVLAKVAAEIGQVPGAVNVVGHSDNRPIRTGAFPDNQVLSERRAAAVAEVLEAHGVERHRLKVEGRADAHPVADNTTSTGRARNRRVDIVVASGAAVPALPVRR